jgi:hypothetical protein
MWVFNEKIIYQIYYIVSVMVIQSSVLRVILGSDIPLCTPIENVPSNVFSVVTCCPNFKLVEQRGIIAAS